MKALVQEGSGSADALHLRDVPVPALLPGRVIVQMRAASVTALDWHLTRGGAFWTILPKIMRARVEPVRGVDVAGTVVSVGPGVSRFKPGDEVFGAGVATFAEYVRAREDRLLLKPAEVSFEEASTLNNSGLAAVQGVRGARVRPGDHVVIHGAGGGIGTFAVQIAKALGANVTAVTGPLNVELVRSLGADQVIDYTQVDFTHRPARYDAVIDIAATRSVSSLCRALKPTGVFVQVGVAKNGGDFGLLARILSVTLRRRVDQRVRSMTAKFALEDLAFLLDLIMGGKLRPVIDRTYPLSEAREAVRYVGTGRARAKVVITA
jgi:NADPH:quinone reductase-like Zn-dependent oxidoreductase